MHFGGEWEGWDEERAAEEQRFLMEKVNRGEWTAGRRPSRRRCSRPPVTPTFQVEASQWLHRRKLSAGDPDGRSKTIRDLEWRLSVVMDKFGPEPIDALDFALADELVVELCEERAAIERAAAEGVPLMRSVLDPHTGRSYEARRRGVSNGSIRKALDAAERVLRDAASAGVLTRRCSRAEGRGAEGRPPAPLVPRGRADRRGPPRGRPDRGRASRADLGDGGADP